MAHLKKFVTRHIDNIAMCQNSMEINTLTHGLGQKGQNCPKEPLKGGNAYFQNNNKTSYQL